MRESDYDTFKPFIQSEIQENETIFIRKKYVDVTDDFVAGALLSKLMFWFMPVALNGEYKLKSDKFLRKLRITKMDKVWLAKRREDWWDELRITARQYDRAIKLLEDMHFVETKIFKFYGDPTTHITLNLDIIIPALEEKKKAIEFKIEVDTKEVWEEPPQVEIPFGNSDTSDVTESVNPLLRKRQVPVTERKTENNKELNPIVSSKQQSEDSLLQVADATNRQKLSNIIAQKKEHACPKNLAPFIEYWESKGLVQHGRTTAVFKDAVETLRKLTNGSLFNGIPDLKVYAGTKFSLADFETAVDNYHLALTSECYLPKNKATIKRTLASFLFSPHATSAWGMSLFISFLVEGLRTNGVIPAYTDKIAELYGNALKKLYKEKVLGGTIGVFTHAQDCQFVEAGNALYGFVETNDSKLSQNISRTPFNISTMYINCLTSDDYLVKRGIGTSLVSSSYSINTRFPLYLKEQGMLVSGQTFNINKIN